MNLVQCPAAGSLSPEMMKSAAAMMKNMRPEEMQRMMEMAQRMQSGQQAGGASGTGCIL